jgi:hypothetical protein
MLRAVLSLLLIDCIRCCTISDVVGFLQSCASELRAIALSYSCTALTFSVVAAAAAAGLEKRQVPLNLITGSVLPLLTTIKRVADSYRTANDRVRRLPVSAGTYGAAVHAAQATAHDYL